MRILTSVSLAAAALLLAAYGLAAAPGIGAKYGARDPRTCSSTKEPTSGAISADQAKVYVICHEEKESRGDLYLVEDVKVEVGKPRPYQVRVDSHPDIDTTAPVYPVRGSFSQYQCVEVSDYMKNAGKNCNRYDHPHAEGVCYKTNYGDWQCQMFDLNRTQTRDVAPPK